ncbi:MAG: hypothetical protein H0W15_05460 [Gemmatimonadales bacterium]|nr:hypothetical protein [Gemmatimonadales bacterium]
MNFTARTRTFALLGNPVSHSLSPRMQNAAFHAAGIDAVYVALRCDADAVVPTMHLLTRAGGGGNVTVPHKRVAADCAPAATFDAGTGAINTFAASDAGLIVANTDIEAVAGSVAAMGNPDGAWLILGTGGSARSAAAAAVAGGHAVAVSSRDAARAEAFANWCDALGAVVVSPAQATVAINATPLGLADDDGLPCHPDALPGVRAVLDLTYRTHGTTAWCSAWRERGVRALDGREPLLLQGAAAWRHWFPGCIPPLDVMRAALSDDVA